MVREGADELTLRAHEEEVVRSFIDTANVGNKKWWPPLVDEDWHVICKAIHKGVEGVEWETMCHKYVELHKAVKCKKSGENGGCEFGFCPVFTSVHCCSVLDASPIRELRQYGDGCDGRHVQVS